MTQGSKYSDEDIERGLQALAEHGSSEKASKATGIPARTLRDWKAKQFADEFAEVRREKRSSLIDDVWEAAREALKVVREKVKEAAAKDAAVIMGILVDKALVMGGEPDTISETRIRDVRTDLERKLCQAAELEAEEEVPEQPDGRGGAGPPV